VASLLDVRVVDDIDQCSPDLGDISVTVHLLIPAATEDFDDLFLAIKEPDDITFPSVDFY
jgi:hypothetical protein